MTRPLAANAEIVRRADETLAKMPLPYAVRDHARGQDVLLRRDPFGQRGAPAVRRQIALEIEPATERFRNSWRHLLAGQLELAPLEDAHLQRLFAMRQEAVWNGRCVVEMLLAGLQPQRVDIVDVPGWFRQFELLPAEVEKERPLGVVGL